MPSPAGYLDVAVSRAAERVRSLNPRVGFDFSLIIAPLLSLFAACFNKSPEGKSNEDPQEYLEDHYDELTATFDRALIDRVRPQARRAVRQAHQKDKSQPRVMHRDMLDQLSHQALYQAMTAPKAEFGTCYVAMLQDAGQTIGNVTTDLLEDAVAKE